MYCFSLKWFLITHFLVCYLTMVILVRHVVSTDNNRSQTDCTSQLHKVHIVEVCVQNSMLEHWLILGYKQVYQEMVYARASMAEFQIN